MNELSWMAKQIINYVYDESGDHCEASLFSELGDLANLVNVTLPTSEKEQILVEAISSGQIFVHEGVYYFAESP